MVIRPQTLDHPTFGACKLVPTILMVRWKAPLDPAGANDALGASALKAIETGRTERAGEGRDPRNAAVNHSSLITWVTGSRITGAVLQRAEEQANVEWIGPVYQAVAAQGDERSYFGINPTVLVLTAQAAAAVDLLSMEATASVDQGRSSLMKGFVVYRLPQGNAIDLGLRLRSDPAIQRLPNAVSFENIPYLAPTCGCGCSDSRHHGKAEDCTPSTAALLPNDALFGSQWGLERIHASRAWSLSKGDPNVVIAVLDQGVELAHPDLNLWPLSYSTITHTNDGGPVGDHGTACAGIIGSRMDNVLGAAGLAPACRVMAIATQFADTQVAEGLFFAADNGARVVSMSFGVYPHWMTWNFAIIEAALQYCHERNVVLIAATGNENQPVSRFPATDPRTFGVGGSNRDDVRKAVGDNSIENWWGACYGPDCDVVAPCLEIPTADRLGFDGYTSDAYNLRFNGTSAATPHVAALAGLLLSVDGSLSNTDIYRLIAVSADKINAGSYVYLPTAGKPHGSWNQDVGYGRINVERALLIACAARPDECEQGPCGVALHEPEACCVSPCEPPWMNDESCLVRYEERFLRELIGREGSVATHGAALEYRITYEHRLCLLGKQHGPLLFTTTLLPGETIRLYHSDRYRRITSAQDRYSVQTTFMQFLSTVHQARVSNTLDELTERLSSARSGAQRAAAGGVFGSLLGWAAGDSSRSDAMSSSHTTVGIHQASETFHQSVEQASQLTQAERSVVISTYEDRESLDVTVRTLQNLNACRAVTYFVRQVMERYALSTRVADIVFRVVATNVPSDWHGIDDLAWLSDTIQAQVHQTLKLLPGIGDVVVRPRPVSLPTDGVVYDPELASCCSCEPERVAAIHINLEKAKAEARKACLEVQELELEVERRRLLLARGELGWFQPPKVVCREEIKAAGSG